MPAVSVPFSRASSGSSARGSAAIPRAGAASAITSAITTRHLLIMVAMESRPACGVDPNSIVALRRRRARLYLPQIRPAPALSRRFEARGDEANAQRAVCDSGKRHLRRDGLAASRGPNGTRDLGVDRREALQVALRVTGGQPRGTRRLGADLGAAARQQSARLVGGREPQPVGLLLRPFETA